MTQTPDTSAEAVEQKPTREQINAMRLKAFASNSDTDKLAYYKACSGWFQDEDYRELDRAATLRALTARLAEAEAERDAALAGAVKVKALEWFEGDEPDEWTSDPYDVWCELGRYQLYYWSIVLGDPHNSAEAAKAAAQADHERRILAAIQPDPEALTAAKREGVRLGLEWAATQLNRSYGQPMTKLHKTLCTAALDPARVAQIAKGETDE